MALTTTVNAGDKILSAWGNEIRNRTLQVFTNAAERDSQWPTAPTGSHAFLSDVQEITVKQTGGWVNIDPARNIRNAGSATINGATGVDVSAPASGMGLTAISKGFRINYAGTFPNFGIGFINGTDFAKNVQIAVPGSGPAFHFQNSDGSAYVPLNASAFTVNSTIRRKQDIRDIADGLGLVERIRPVFFRWRGAPVHDTTTGELIATEPASDPVPGFIAEEMASVVPEVVERDEGGEPFGINYGALVPVLVRAVQQLTARVASLEASLKVAAA